ncbi:MAG: hypothetical protein E7467_02480 [Ruminococcaceae bacterium]|nr:hypothetical protein [Oscillospiraceae bacterium]
MNNLSPFQKALLQSVNDSFCDVPCDAHASLAAHPACTIKRDRLVRRLALIAAAVLLMGSIVFAAVRFSLDAQVESEIYTIPEYSVTNQRHDITFKGAVADADAPDEIEVFMLPTAIVSATTIDAGACYLENGEYCWYPARQEGTPIIENIRDFHMEWTVDDSQVSFFQQTAKSVKPDQPLISVHYDADAKVKYSEETITIGDTEIFCFIEDFSECDWEGSVNRFWFWTDGDYLYMLQSALSTEQMQQMFESLAPAEDILGYIGAPE